MLDTNPINEDIDDLTELKRKRIIDVIRSIRENIATSTTEIESEDGGVSGGGAYLEGGFMPKCQGI